MISSPTYSLKANHRPYRPKVGGGMKRERINEALGVVFLLVGLFAFVSLLTFHPSDYAFYTSHPNTNYRNVTGVMGAYLAYYLHFTFGASAFSIPVLFLFWAVCFFFQKVPHRKWMEFVGIAISIVAVASLASLVVGLEWKIRAGGVFGYFIARNLETYFGVLGGVIITLSCLALALLLATDFLLYPFLERAWLSVQALVMKIRSLFLRDLGIRGVKKTMESRSEWSGFVPPKVKKYERPETVREERKEARSAFEVSSMAPSVEKPLKSKEEQLEETAGKQRANQTKEKAKEESQLVEPLVQDISARRDERVPITEYVLPPVALLRDVVTGAPVPVEDDLHHNSLVLEETLRDFGIEVKVIEVEQGPVITRYELWPAPGVKVNSIVSLGDDLALALKTTSVRFLTPVPGKSAIGIEVPNSSQTTVFLKELIESPESSQKDLTLPLMLGKDTSGKPLISDLTEMPHLLIAGVTGSGKTICLNSIIAGLLFTKSPEELRFIMVDPKMVELALYSNIPHMLAPVVTDVRKAAATLNWLVNEMERRYRIFASAGTRNIQSFNERRHAEGENDSDVGGGEDIPRRLPYVVLVIDELADLMLVSRDKVEGAITRLAQLSRAVGIHLILATQRPSVDVITGVIKANFPARISFKVASKVDSRTVLDMNGADQLIGKGDMLFLQPGEAKPIRGQGTFVTDEEIEAIVQFVKNQGRAQYVSEIAQAAEIAIGGRILEKDELYDEAVQVVLETRQASVSVLQRRLKLGYGRAARIMDMMEQEGIVGPPQGSKPREILIDRIEEITGPSSVTS